MKFIRYIYYILIIACSNHLKCDEITINNESIIQESIISEAVRNQNLVHESAHVTQKKKAWTIIIYMSADNDLAIFGRKNILQLARIGSNQNMNILVHLDTKVQGGRKVTLRYFVEKNKLVLTNFDEPHSQRMDSGNPKTVVDCFKWATTHFPADHYLFDFWNHGTGIIDIGRPRAINPSTLFTFNPQNSLFELDRTVPFLDFISLSLPESQRGVCFDDSTGNYLNNQNIAESLNVVSRDMLGGKKIDIVVFDACLMAMLEVANILKPYVNYMVSSQEVELGTGYDYYKMLLPLSSSSPQPKQFAEHIVRAYQETYKPITRDYTQSALDLSSLSVLESNVNQVAQLLIESIKQQHGNHTKKALQQSRHKLACTHFEEPSYIDLHHWYTNVLTNLHRFQYKNKQNGQRMLQSIKSKIQEGLGIIGKIVIANATGQNLTKAQGISIYFPERHIHSSYHRTSFSKENKWLEFLNYYLLS